MSCKHGRLARSCEICELERENAELKKLCKRIINEIPCSWLDSLLSGPENVLGNMPYGCQQIERLLNAIRKRASALVAKGGKG
jgi:hypothetical protein